MDIEQIAREAREAAMEARTMAEAAKALALAHVQGCERAYRENERRLGVIDKKLDLQDERSAKARDEWRHVLDEQDDKLAEILQASAKRYWATIGGGLSIGCMLAWQVYVYLHPYAH